MSRQRFIIVFTGLLYSQPADSWISCLSLMRVDVCCLLKPTALQALTPPSAVGPLKLKHRDNLLLKQLFVTNRQVQQRLLHVACARRGLTPTSQVLEWQCKGFWRGSKGFSRRLFLKGFSRNSQTYFQGAKTKVLEYSNQPITAKNLGRSWLLISFPFRVQSAKSRRGQDHSYLQFVSCWDIF